MLKHLMVIAAIYPVPALAGPTLWRDIEAGMTPAQIQSLYPERPGEIHHTPKQTVIENVQQVGRCHPDVHVEYENGAVARVRIESRYRGFPKEACGDEASKAMLAKYGQPIAVDQAERDTGGLITSGLFKGLDTSRTERRTEQTWTRDGVFVTFMRDDPDVNDLWRITYEPQKDIGL